jgi:adenylylsulfate kinase
MVNAGKVCWITGLAGAGKTTIGKALYKKLKEKTETVVLLDGDELRMVFGKSIGYSYNDRKGMGEKYGRLCKILSMQGISIICCTIGMIEPIRRWNYENIDKYMEVYINTPMFVLEQRDQKGLYSEAKKGLIKDIIGIDIAAETPKMPEIEILNDGRDKIDDIVLKIVTKFESL